MHTQGDQASIVAGAINFVKELEQRLQSLEGHKLTTGQCEGVDGGQEAPSPFAHFFTFPQYSMSATSTPAPPANDEGAEAEASGSKPSAVADVEVTMVESHANLRMLSRRRPRQLLRLLVALQGHRLTVLHLNMTSAGHMVLYSLNLKVHYLHILPVQLNNSSLSDMHAYGSQSKGFYSVLASIGLAIDRKSVV